MALGSIDFLCMPKGVPYGLGGFVDDLERAIDHKLEFTREQGATLDVMEHDGIRVEINPRLVNENVLPSVFEAFKHRYTTRLGRENGWRRVHFELVPQEFSFGEPVRERYIIVRFEA